MKMRFQWNVRTTAGLVIGALTPFIVIPVTIGIIAWAQDFYYSVLWAKFKIDIIVQSKFISLSIIPNLLWFYLFLNKERYDLARGVIIGSALYLPYIVYINLIR